MKFKKIIIICIEGERNVTEKTFFEKIAKCSKQLFENIEIIYISFDHSIAEKNKEKIHAFLASVHNSPIIYHNKNVYTEYIYFIIHDDDNPTDKKSLNDTFQFIESFLIEKENTSVARISEKNKSFDYFLYYIFNKKMLYHQKKLKILLKNIISKLMKTICGKSYT